jgi:hypothetical protein
MNMNAVREVTSYSLVYRDQRFKLMCCFRLQGMMSLFIYLTTRRHILEESNQRS